LAVDLLTRFEDWYLRAPLADVPVAFERRVLKVSA
jgi:hypothetical protein